MPDRSTVIYRYDGSYQGFLCCVAQCFQDKALPVSIRPYDEEQQSLYGSKDIPTRLELAQRVERSIPRRISPQALRLVREGFLTTLPEREMALLRFVLLGYKYGPPVTRMTTHPAVHALEKAVLALNNEAHHVLEFLRFADCGEFLAAKIQPQGKVLPLVAPHFCDRLPSESFMIYDSTHGMGFTTGRTRRGSSSRRTRWSCPPPARRNCAGKTCGRCSTAPSPWRAGRTPSCGGSCAPSAIGP